MNPIAQEDRFRILLVDDEKSNLDVLNHILKQDHDIYIAKSGQAGLKQARDRKPDLILLDIVMPDIDGFEVLRALKEDDETRGIPVMFITGRASAGDEERGLMLGAVDYITKPFNNAIVKARVKTQLQLVRQMRTIERLGLLDPLTGMPNRRRFDDHLSKEWARAMREKTPLSLLMVDADHFKAYNDAYGHPQGDVLLQTISRIMQDALLRPTDLAARLGGEEFGIILPGTNAEGACAVAENLRANIEQTRVPVGNNDAYSSITVSIGQATAVPEMDQKVNTLMNAADNALYEAKRSGRNQVCMA